MLEGSLLILCGFLICKIWALDPQKLCEGCQVQGDQISQVVPSQARSIMVNPRMSKICSEKTWEDMRRLRLGSSAHFSAASWHLWWPLGGWGCVCLPLASLSSLSTSEISLLFSACQVQHSFCGCLGLQRSGLVKLEEEIEDANTLGTDIKSHQAGVDSHSRIRTTCCCKPLAEVDETLLNAKHLPEPTVSYNNGSDLWASVSYTEIKPMP